MPSDADRPTERPTLTSNPLGIAVRFVRQWVGVPDGNAGSAGVTAPAEPAALGPTAVHYDILRDAYVRVRLPTPEEVEAMVERQRERQREVQIASERARGLLMSLLNQSQRRQFDARGWFEVVGNATGRTYRIYHGAYGNVRLVEDDREVGAFCAQPECVPVFDVLAAQKLQIECDENAFLAIANYTELAR